MLRQQVGFNARNLFGGCLTKVFSSLQVAHFAAQPEPRFRLAQVER
jgi:hypothetical protein